MLTRALLSHLVDVPMSRVKFNVNTEYAYLQNFKILQSTFGSYRINPLQCVLFDTLSHFVSRYLYTPSG